MLLGAACASETILLLRKRQSGRESGAQSRRSQADRPAAEEERYRLVSRELHQPFRRNFHAGLDSSPSFASLYLGACDNCVSGSLRRFGEFARVSSGTQRGGHPSRFVYHWRAGRHLHLGHEPGWQLYRLDNCRTASWRSFYLHPGRYPHARSVRNDVRSHCSA